MDESPLSGWRITLTDQDGAEIETEIHCDSCHGFAMDQEGNVTEWHWRAPKRKKDPPAGSKANGRGESDARSRY